MKKTLLATAIAGALGTMAAGAQAATVYNQDGSKLDVYGNVQLGVRSIETAEFDGDTYTGSESESDLFDNGSTIGFKGEHIINPNLTGYFRAEFEFQADDNKGSSGGIDDGDQSYLGLTGDFGDARLGSWDPLIDDWVQDPVSNNEYFDLRDSGGQADDSNLRESNKLTYTSPIMNGLQFAIGTSYNGDGEDVRVVGPTGQVNQELRSSEDSTASLFGGLRYMVGDWTFAAVYDDLKNFRVVDTTVADDDGDDFGKQYGVNASWQANDDLRVSVKWEQLNADFADNADIDYYGIGARYSYGEGDIYGAYQYVDAEENAIEINQTDVAFTGTGDREYNQFVLGATYNLSSQMYVWLEGGFYDREDDLGDGVATGVAYSF